MSVTPSTLSSIQQAGQAIDIARLAIIAAVTEHAQRVMVAVAEQPSSGDNDKLFSSWKTLSRLAQEVNVIEEEFKVIYQTAADLAQPETSVLMALPHSAQHKTPARDSADTASNSTVEDVQFKPGAAKRGPKPGAVRVTRKAASNVGGLSTNDSKVLDFLATQLNRKSWTRLTQAGIPDGAGIPIGSIGLALRRLIGFNQIVEGVKGRYKLVRV
jgi:hypothetical protein